MRLQLLLVLFLARALIAFSAQRLHTAKYSRRTLENNSVTSSTQRLPSSTSRPSLEPVRLTSESSGPSDYPVLQPSAKTFTIQPAEPYSEPTLRPLAETPAKSSTEATTVWEASSETVAYRSPEELIAPNAYQITKPISGHPAAPIASPTTALATEQTSKPTLTPHVQLAPGLLWRPTARPVITIPSAASLTVKTNANLNPVSSPTAAFSSSVAGTSQLVATAFSTPTFLPSLMPHMLAPANSPTASSNINTRASAITTTNPVNVGPPVVAPLPVHKSMPTNATVKTAALVHTTNTSFSLLPFTVTFIFPSTSEFSHLDFNLVEFITEQHLYNVLQSYDGSMSKVIGVNIITAESAIYSNRSDKSKNNGTRFVRLRGLQSSEEQKVVISYEGNAIYAAATTSSNATSTLEGDVILLQYSAFTEKSHKANYLNTLRDSAHENNTGFRDVQEMAATFFDTKDKNGLGSATPIYSTSTSGSTNNSEVGSEGSMNDTSFQQSTANSSDGLNMGLIVGVSIGSVIFLVLLLLALSRCFRGQSGTKGRDIDSKTKPNKNNNFYDKNNPNSINDRKIENTISKKRHALGGQLADFEIDRSVDDSSSIDASDSYMAPNTNSTAASSNVYGHNNNRNGELDYGPSMRGNSTTNPKHNKKDKAKKAFKTFTALRPNSNSNEETRRMSAPPGTDLSRQRTGQSCFSTCSDLYNDSYSLDGQSLSLASNAGQKVLDRVMAMSAYSAVEQHDAQLLWAKNNNNNHDESDSSIDASDSGNRDRKVEVNRAVSGLTARNDDQVEGESVFSYGLLASGTFDTTGTLNSESLDANSHLHGATSYKESVQGLSGATMTISDRAAARNQSDAGSVTESSTDGIEIMMDDQHLAAEDLKSDYTFDTDSGDEDAVMEIIGDPLVLAGGRNGEEESARGRRDCRSLSRVRMRVDGTNYETEEAVVSRPVSRSQPRRAMQTTTGVTEKGTMQAHSEEVSNCVSIERTASIDSSTDPNPPAQDHSSHTSNPKSDTIQNLSLLSAVRSDVSKPSEPLEIMESKPSLEESLDESDDDDELGPGPIAPSQRKSKSGNRRTSRSVPPPPLTLMGSIRDSSVPRPPVSTKTTFASDPKDCPISTSRVVYDDQMYDTITGSVFKDRIDEELDGQSSDSSEVLDDLNKLSSFLRNRRRLKQQMRQNHNDVDASIVVKSDESTYTTSSSIIGGRQTDNASNKSSHKDDDEDTFSMQKTQIPSPTTVGQSRLANKIYDHSSFRRKKNTAPTSSSNAASLRKARLAAARNSVRTPVNN